MKKFFAKKVLDYKFTKAGTGHKLDEEKAQPKPVPAKTQAAPRKPSTQSSQAAGSAAIARLEHDRVGNKPRATSQELPTKRDAPPRRSEACSIASGTSSEQRVDILDVTSRSILVHVICPVCQKTIPHSTILEHFSICLQEEYLKEPLTASVQMIHTLCHNQEKRKLCIDTLCKYLDNIKEHPHEEKYRRIRIKNKSFSEKVCQVEGALLFLEAVGFQQQLLPHQDGEDQFLVLPEEKARELEELEVHKELLTSTEPLKTKVDRNLQVFRPSPRATHFDLPREFYKLTVEEIRREQKLKTEIVEHESVLRTRAMRERDETRMAVRHYRFILLRIRMPDGLLLQGVFTPLEKLSDVRLLISEAVADPTSTFSLSALGKPLQDDTSTLAHLGLAPSAVLNLSWGGSESNPHFLKPELLARIQELV